MFSHSHLSQIVKHSVAYSFAFSHPFSYYVEAYPILQQEIFEQTNMEYGMHHEVVKMLQTKLQKLSYYDSSVDGEFGILTEYAIKKFQDNHDLEMNGQVDVPTKQKIISVEIDLYEKILEQDVDFSYGEKSEEIFKIQEALHYFGFYEATLDSIYGPITDHALTRYKEDSGLKVVHIEKPPTHLEVVEPMTLSTNITTNDEQIKPQKKAKNITVVSPPTTDMNLFISTAKELQGVPYVWGGTTSAGFDCSGFIQYVYKQNGVQLPRTVNEMWNATIQLDTPSIGDLIFFETYKPGPSHAGIYIGNNQFIHADATNGVTISSLDENYWSNSYIGAKRVNLK
jgi:cell wall-associated NlpC family hydrolase